MSGVAGPSKKIHWRHKTEVKAEGISSLNVATVLSHGNSEQGPGALYTSERTGFFVSGLGALWVYC